MSLNSQVIAGSSTIELYPSEQRRTDHIVHQLGIINRIVMVDRKYRFKQPTKPLEHLEALYEELSLSPVEANNFRPTATLKDHVAAVLAYLQQSELRRKDEKDDESNSVDWALGAVAILSTIFLFNGALGSKDWAWLDNHRFAIRLWGVAFAALFVGLSIERSSFFKSLWTFGFTKLVASIAVSALIVFSTGKASSLINGVFPVDASALPYTRTIVAGLLAFQYSYPLLIVIAIFAALHGLNALQWLRSKFSNDDSYELPPLQSIAFLILSIVILFISTRWVNNDFSEEGWSAKVYRLAHVLDFDANYQCANVPVGLSVIFLGPDHSRVLVDLSNAQTNDIESFVDGSISRRVVVPRQFYIVPCELTPVAQGG